MDRRNFLTGTFGGILGAGMLIKAPTSEIEKLTLVENAPIELGIPELTNTDIGHIVFNYQGIPLGVITKIHRSTDMVNVTSYEDLHAKFIPGLQRARLIVECSGIGVPIKVESYRK